MRSLFYLILGPLASLLIFGCGASETKPASPLETYRTYTKAVKQKDTTTMKLLLSGESLRMHEQQAKAQNTTVDEIVKRESLFNETQTRVEYRNETIDGERATLEVKNLRGDWETIPFVFEDNQWKIDKKGYADRLAREIEEANRRAEEEFQKDRIELNDANSQIPTNTNSNTDSSVPF